MRKIGMSRTEVVVIVLILLLLVAVMDVPRISPGERARARKNRCTSNQRQIYIAMAMYASEHGEQIPGTLTTVAKHRWALSNIADVEQISWRGPLDIPEKMLRCPSGVRGKTSYGCNATLPGAKLAAITRPDSTILIADTAGHELICAAPEFSMRHSMTGKAADCGYIASFVDGHVDFDKTRPADPPALDVTRPTVPLGPDNKTNYILDGVNIITVDSAGKITPDARASGKLYPNSYLTISVTGATTRAVDVLQVRSATHHTSVLLPADAKARDIYVLKLPDSGLAGWKLTIKGGGPATLMPTMTP